MSVEVGSLCVIGADEATVSVLAPRLSILAEVEAESAMEGVVVADGGRVAGRDAPYRAAAVLPN